LKHLHVACVLSFIDPKFVSFPVVYILFFVVYIKTFFVSKIT